MKHQSELTGSSFACVESQFALNTQICETTESKSEDVLEDFVSLPVKPASASSMLYSSTNDNTLTGNTVPQLLSVLLNGPRLARLRLATCKGYLAKELGESDGRERARCHQMRRYMRLLECSLQLDGLQERVLQLPSTPLHVEMSIRLEVPILTKATDKSAESECIVLALV